jgi:hypothetical protein
MVRHDLPEAVLLGHDAGHALPGRGARIGGEREVGARTMAHDHAVGGGDADGGGRSGEHGAGEDDPQHGTIDA